MNGAAGDFEDGHGHAFAPLDLPKRGPRLQ
jgi:hypothetical protein